MQKLSKNTTPQAKTPQEAHQNDVFTDTLNETAKKGYYLEAQKELTPKPYAEKNRNLFSFSKGFTSVYHVVSFLLGIASVYLIAKAFHTGEITILKVFISILIGFLLVGLLVGLEMLKSQSAISLFIATSKEESAPTGAKLGLGFTFVLSVLFSAIGGAFLTVEMNDKSTIIQTELAIQTDSLKNMYSSQLEGYEMSINSSKATLKKYSKGWRANNARKDLKEATEAKNNLLEKLDNRITLESDKAVKNTLGNAKEGANTAYIVSFIVLCLEIICIICYRFRFIYLRNTEREGVNFDILPKKESQAADTPTNEPLTELAEILKMFLSQTQVVTTDVAQAVQPYTIPNIQPQKSIGFQFRTKDTTQAVKRKSLDEGNRECLNCKEPFIYKTWNHTYCSEKCRITAWEAKTGKTFRKRKK
ncbi:hypothetical protein WAF17_13020 [Bernardetia sp. ABR2-2B]|uniref:hypothetical protein n=1 Tax=Bernardetia sp. ABR2-2B TaxID=3127472 RepID=UPI0030D12F92